MGTHGSGFTKRHSRVLTGRGTHGGANIKDISPGEYSYGTIPDLEQIGGDYIAPDSIDNGHLIVGSITASKIAVGSGLGSARNLLINGGFRDGVTGWSVSDAFTGAGTTSHGLYTTTATDWTLRDGDIDGYDATSGPFGSSYYVTTTKSGGSWFIHQTVPVVAGEYYSLSGRSGNHRATGVTMGVNWLDSSGTVVSTDLATTNTGSYTGGAGLSAVGSATGWQLHYIEGMTPPATAVSAQVLYAVYAPRTSGSELYAFFDQVMFTNTQLAVPYLPREVGDLRAAEGSVIINSDGVTIINGALTVASDTGSTVIIDGTSNMFKIQASGTISVTASASALNTNTVTLTGLGTVTIAPSHLCHISGASASTSPKYGSTYLANISEGFAAATSGGSVNQRTNIVDVIGFMSTVITSSQVVVEIVLFNESGSSVTIYGKYYVLKEAAV